MSHPKRYPIQIWFFNEDLFLSAQQHQDKLLVNSMYGCYRALLCTYFYFYGIRSKKFFDYYFADCRKDATMESLFPCWSLPIKPKFTEYSSRTSKWCRKCKEHFDYIKRYLGILIEEYEYRFDKAHMFSRFIEWIDFDAPKINIPEAKLSKITVEWKVLNPLYRRKDILEGYRLQCKSILTNAGLDPNFFSKRDVPDWLLEKENVWMT